MVLADADLDITIEHAVKRRLMCASQTCIAPKRFLVDESIADEFETRLVDAFAAVQIGDPRERARSSARSRALDILENLERQVSRDGRAGACSRPAAARLDRPGYFLPPTILAGVEPGMTAFTDETFGPVVAITRFSDEDTAVGSPTTRATGSGRRSGAGHRACAPLARQIDSGACRVDTLVASDPRCRASASSARYGRELAAVGLHEFTNIRTYKIA